MRPRLFASFHARLISAFFLLNALMGIAVFFVAIRVYEARERRAFELRATSVASLLAVSAMNGVYELRFDQLRLLLEKVLQQPHVLYAYVYDGDGRILADGTAANRYFDTIPQDLAHRAAIGANATLIQYTRDDSHAPGDVLDVAQPIIPAGEEAIGGVRIGLTVAPVRESVARARTYAVVAGTAFVLLGGLLSTLIGRRLTRPIGELVRATRRVASGEPDVQIRHTSRDEIGMLAESFNRMAAQVRQHAEELEARIRLRTGELEEANRQLETASRHKSTFLANVSHELRTPLNAIIGFTRLVLRKTEGQIAPLQRDNLRKVLVSAEQLLDLINGLLDLSKIEAGRMDVATESFSIEEVIDVAVATIEPILPEGRVRVVRTVAPDIPRLTTDRDKLKQIVLNLLGNAAKFTDEGEIAISAWSENGSLKLMVSDTGIGIEKEALPHIFEEFHQVGTSRRRPQAGSGLGLAIVKSLLGLLGGDIRVESEVGKGSAFTVTIPVRWRPRDRR